MFSQLIALAVNNLLLFIAGGALAMLLAWGAWKKFESYNRSINSWSALVFFAAKSVVILLVIFYVARTIYVAADGAVKTAVNSGSVQSAGQLAIGIGTGLDYLASGTGATAPIQGGMQTVNIPQFDTSVFSSLPSLAVGGQTGGLITLPSAQVEASAETVADAVVSSTPQEYSVKRGDTMYEIAQSVLGDGNRYLELCRLNQSVVGSDCSRIRSGMVLKLPGTTQSESPNYTEWKNAVTAWQVAPTPTRARAASQQQWSAAVSQWTSKPAQVAPTATPTQSAVDMYAPAMNPEAQATKDAASWNVNLEK